MKALLDTCVISELVAKKPNPGVVEFVDALDTDDVYLSVITIGEIIKGIEKLTDSPRKAELRGWLQEDLLARFHGKIIPLGTDIIVEWGVLTARLEAQGKPMPAIDSLIAATALAEKMSLVTRNVGDFNAAGVEILNPWK
jgi:predicted nucleic acid-binding protein